MAAKTGKEEDVSKAQHQHIGRRILLILEQFHKTIRNKTYSKFGTCPKIRFHPDEKDAQVVFIGNDNITENDETWYEIPKTTEDNLDERESDKKFGITQAQFVIESGKDTLEQTKNQNECFEMINSCQVASVEVKDEENNELIEDEKQKQATSQINVRKVLEYTTKTTMFDTFNRMQGTVVNGVQLDSLDHLRSGRMMDRDSYDQLNDEYLADCDESSAENNGILEMKDAYWLKDYNPSYKESKLDLKFKLEENGYFRVKSKVLVLGINAKVPIYQLKSDDKKSKIRKASQIKSFIAVSGLRMHNPTGVLPVSHVYMTDTRTSFRLSREFFDKLKVVHLIKELNDSCRQMSSMKKHICQKGSRFHRNWIPASRCRNSSTVTRNKYKITDNQRLNSTEDNTCQAKLNQEFCHTCPKNETLNGDKNPASKMEERDGTLYCPTQLTSKGTIERLCPFIFEKHISGMQNVTSYLQSYEVVVYPVTAIRYDTHPPVSSPPEGWQWLLRCPRLDLRVQLDDEMEQGNDLTPLFPDSRLTYVWDIDVFPRPLTADHLVVHIWNRLYEIRQAENMVVIHDRSPGSTFERSETVVEGRDYVVTRLIDESLQQRLSRCTLSEENENGRVALFEMPVRQFKITDVIMQTLLRHPGILRMDTAVIQNGKLKIFMENFDAALADVNGPWGDQDILQLLFRLLEAVENLHRNEIVLLDINDKTLVLKNSTDPTTVAIWKFSSAQFDSNKLIPLEFNESSPKYRPPEWWHILQLREYSHVMKKVDSWQIGCLLMKLLLGEDPQLVHLIQMRHDERFIDNHFEERNIIESRRLIQREIARRIRRRIVHPNLKKIIFGFLEPCPSRRMSVEEALALLRQSSYSPHGI